MIPSDKTPRYCCPGEPYEISRSVHLGRLLSHYPKCRGCMHAADVLPLPSPTVRRLRPSQNLAQDTVRWTDDGLWGSWESALEGGNARRLAVALGTFLRRSLCGDQHRDARRNGRHDVQQVHRRVPSVVLAGDGRRFVPPLLASAADGLRWAGCDVVELPPSSASCVAWSARHLAADGALFIGPGDRIDLGDKPSHAVGIKLWLRDAMPPCPDELESIACLFDVGVDRATRTCGGHRRANAGDAYLAHLAHYFHAIRPLQFVLETACRPWRDDFMKLAAAIDCQVVSCSDSPRSPTDDSADIRIDAKASPPAVRAGSPWQRVARRVRETRAHFGIRVDGAGEMAQVVDERGALVSGEAIAGRVADKFLSARPGGTCVVAESNSPALDETLAASGATVVRVGDGRATMAQAMFAEKAFLGVGPSGSMWFADPARHDALETLAVLLNVLSRSDAPLSALVDDRLAASGTSG